MKIQLRAGNIEAARSPALVLFLPQTETPPTVPPLYSAMIHRICGQKDFSGKLEETIWLYPSAGAERLLLVGLGEWDKSLKENAARQNFQNAIGHAVLAAQKLAITDLQIALAAPIVEKFGDRLAAQYAAEALWLANYRFQKYKSTIPDKEKRLQEITLLLADERQMTEARDGVRVGEIIGKWSCFARDLQNTPSNDLPPARLAAIAAEQAAALKIACTVHDEKGIRELGMGALLGVGQGSVNPPRFVVLEYKPQHSPRANDAPLVLVGKGITFDTGGISIKSADDMDLMKHDMSGAAVVLATLGALAELQSPLPVIGLLPMAENMPSGSAQRPGDIVRTCSGKTIEVADTDAEGRLILAEALGYAQRFKPRAIIDLATLTGAIYVVLGETAAGLFSNDADLAARLKNAAERTGERVWELPLFAEFFEYMKSDVADIRNIASKRSGGGASKAAAFLATFAENCKWAHLDIAAMAHPREDKPLVPKGGSGFGVRLMLQFCRDFIE